MDPLSVWITIEYDKNGAPRSHIQRGVVVTPIVITTANRIFIEDPNSHDKYKIKNITVEVRSKHGIFLKEATDWTVFHCQNVEEALESSFQLLDGDDEDEWHRVEHLSYFVAVSVDTMVFSQTQYCNIERGMEVLVSSVTIVDSWNISEIVGKGIISKVMGRNEEIFLTDTVVSTMGSPVYRYTYGRVLSGMIIKSIPIYINEEFEGSSGFMLGVNINAVLQCLDLQGYSPRPKLRPVTSLPNSQMRTDFSVIIQTGRAKGTGIIIHEDGFILTNAHVVNYMENIDVTVKFNDDVYTATVLFASKFIHLDIALLHISEGLKFPCCKMSERCHFRGEVVYAVGHAKLLGKFNSFISQGNIVEFIDNTISTTCIAWPGSSGGALLNEEGEAIGLLTRMETSYDFLTGRKKRLSISIPVYLFKNIVEQYWKQEIYTDWTY